VARLRTGLTANHARWRPAAIRPQVRRFCGVAGSFERHRQLQVVLPDGYM